MQNDNVRMPQAIQNRRLALEPLEEASVGGAVWKECLDCKPAAADAAVARKVNHSHSAATKFAHDLKIRDRNRSTGGCGHPTGITGGFGTRRKGGQVFPHVGARGFRTGGEAGEVFGRRGHWASPSGFPELGGSCCGGCLAAAFAASTFPAC